MKQVNITELRAHLPTYLHEVQEGESIEVISRGKRIAHIIPPTGVVEQARERLADLRKRARISDVVSPLDVKWDAARDRA